MERADLALWADPCLLREEYLGACLALLPNPPRKMLEGHHAPCPEQPFSPARVNERSMCKASKPAKPGCWRWLFASGIRIPDWSPASPLWKWSWPPLLLSLTLTPFFSSLQVSSPAHAWAAPLPRDTHTPTPKERISQLDLSAFPPFPAQPGSEWERNFVVAYLRSPPGVSRGGSGAVNQQSSPGARDAELSPSTAASPPPPPRLLGCYAITSPPPASRRASKDIPLTRQSTAGSKDEPTESGRPLGEPGRRASRRRAGRRVGMQRQARTGEGGDKIHMERGIEKGGGEMHTRTESAVVRALGSRPGLPGSATLPSARRHLPPPPGAAASHFRLDMATRVLEIARHVRLLPYPQFGCLTQDFII